MSVTGYDVIPGTRKGAVTAEGATAERELRLFTDDEDDGEGVIRAWIEATFPIGSAHPDDADLLLTQAPFSLQDEADNIWGVTLQYATPSGTGSAPNNDPLSRPATYRWTGGADLKEYSVDVDGNILANSAHEPFDIPPQRYEGSWAVEVVYNLAPASHPAAGALHCTVNDGDVTIDGSTFGEGRCLWIYRDGPKLKENGVVFYQVTVEILIKPAGETWDDRILDAGYNEIDVVTGLLTPIIDSNGTESRKPWALNGLGQKIPPPTPVTDPITPVHRTFKPYVRASWPSTL